MGKSKTKAKQLSKVTVSTVLLVMFAISGYLTMTYRAQEVVAIDYTIDEDINVEAVTFNRHKSKFDRSLNAILAGSEKALDSVLIETDAGMLVIELNNITIIRTDNETSTVKTKKQNDLPESRRMKEMTATLHLNKADAKKASLDYAALYEETLSFENNK